MRAIVLFFLFVLSARGAEAHSSITLYKGEAFQGESWTLHDDVKNLADYPGWNDAAMSAVVHGGVWEVCTEAYYNNCTVLQGDDMRDFHRIGLDYKISSLREVSFGAMPYNPGYYSGANNITVLGQGAEERSIRAAPYNGFSDDFFYSAGRMAGGQPPVYTHDMGRPDNHHDHDGGRTRIIWNTPQNPDGGVGYLSPCQASVQQAVNNRLGRASYEMTFTGSPVNGQVFDQMGNRFNYSCNGSQIFIWQ